MKTIKYLYILIAACLTLTACDSGDDNDDLPDVKGKFLERTCNMPAEESTQTFSLTGLTSRVLRTQHVGSAPWVTVTVMPYSKGTPEAEIACQENTNKETRSHDVIFLAGADTLLLTIRQAAASSTSNVVDVNNPNDTPTDQPAYSR